MTLQRWTIDPTVSSISFKIAHLAISKVRGIFSRFEGELELDERGLSGSKARITIAADSVNTNEDDRDAETRSERFLDVARFPAIEFVSTGVEVIDASEVVVVGDLTLHGVTAPVRVYATYNGRAVDAEGRTRVGWEAELTVRRDVFGLLWHPALEQVSGFLLGDEIEISADIEAVLAEPS